MSLERARARLSLAVDTGAMLILTLLAIYMVTQFLRGSVAVIAPDLAGALGLTAADLGLLSSVFFFVFALAQLPVGVALDRFGARRVLLVCAALIVLGCVAFAAATSSAGLIGARALMGLGCSSAFMASLAIYARRFPPERFATLTGLQYGIGSIGSLFATVPLAWAAAVVGWRASFVGVAVITLVAAALIATVVQDEDSTPEAEKRESLWSAVVGIAEVIRTPSVGRLFLMHVTCYSSFALFVGLWGGPYLSHIYGYGLSQRGELLLIPAVAQIGGAFLWGPADRLFGCYKVPVLLGAAGTVLALVWVGLAGPMSLGVLVVWMVLFGLVSAYTVVVIAHGKALFAPQHVGRGLTLFNMATMGGVFITQAVSGLVIDLFAAPDGRYPFAAYRAVFLLQALFIAAATIGYVRARDPRRN
jgi:predicted MFS family arabinose efflux permease